MEKEKCFDCIYWDKPSDAPENVPFDCMWQPSEENGWELPCREEEK